MNGWMDWREIEKHNDWGMREKTDAMGRRWNDDAASWDARWKSDEAFTKRQADSLKLLPSDTVLDIGCGAGPLAVNIAHRVKHVIAQDFGTDMLGFVRKNAQERGLENVETLQGNWHDMEPGVDLPICDVAITRWSPAQGDILKMSRCATRYCYSLMTCSPKFEKDGSSTGGMWCRSTVDEALNTTPRPCARKYGFNVHFNLLYDHGANPEVFYVKDEKVVEAPTLEELRSRLALRWKRSGKARWEDVPEQMRSMLENGVAENDNGTWRHISRHSIAVLGWNPREVVY